MTQDIRAAWSEYMDEFTFLQNKKSGRSYTYALNSLLQETGIVKVEELTAPVFTKWVKIRMERDKIGKQTATGMINAMSGFVKWCVRRDYLVKNPLDGFVRQGSERTLPRALRWTEAEAIVDSVQGQWLWQRDQAFLDFLLHTGARSQEALGLTMDRLDIEGAKVSFTSTKSRQPRVVFIGPKYMLKLKAYLDWRKQRWPTSQYVFPTRNGGRLLYRNALDILYRYKLKVNLHQFRHTFASECLRRTGNLRMVQVLLGHSKPETTARYLLVFDEEKQQMAYALDDVDYEQKVNARGKVVRREIL